MAQSLKQSVMHGFIWNGVEQFGIKAFAIIFNFLLVRLLSPKEFGTMAIIMSFILIGEVLVNSGLGVAIVQKKDLTSLDENSVFFTNIFFSLIIYGLLYFLAPFISSFYNIDNLQPLIRVVGLSILIFSFGIIHEARLLRQMAFKRRLKVNLIALLFSGIIGVLMAWHGYGVWALAIQTLTKAFFTVIGLCIATSWIPHLKFDFSELYKMLKFGINYMFASLLGKLCLALYPLLIGKKFTKIELGFFDRGKYYPQTIVGSASDVFLKVMFPAFSKLQNNKTELLSLFSKTNQLVSFIIIPISFFMAVCAPSFVYVIMGKQWMCVIPYLRVFCFMFMFEPINMLCFHLVTSTGHSGIRLLIEICQKTLELIVLLCTIRFGIFAITIGMAVHAFMALAVNLFFCNTIIKYNILSLWRDVKNYIFIATITSLISFTIPLLTHSHYVLLPLQISVCVGIYLWISFILKIPILYYIFDMCMKIVRRKEL